MLKSVVVRCVFLLLLVVGTGRSVVAQNFPFTSGPIPLCDTSTFTATISGIGQLSPPGWNPWQPTWWIQSLTINITSDHPQTLQIIVTSPEGTDLLLSEYNGAGGQNYTNTVFNYDGYPSITTGTAPFTGYFNAQGGSFSAFDYEDPNGTWTITVIDTACTNTSGGGGGGPWLPGWFDGSGGNGGFAIGFDPGPPPCWGGIPYGQAYICPGQTVDILNYYSGSGYNIMVTAPDWTPVPDPTMVSTPGTYWIDATGWDGCWYSATFDVIESQPSLGADQVVDQCDGAGAVDLTALFNLAGGTPGWSLDGASITTAAAGAATVSGVYQLICVGNGGCSDTAQVTLNITAGPALGADQSVSICPSSPLDLTTLYNTTGLTASWGFGGSAYATPTAATGAGVYTLDVTDGNGCADQAEVTLVVQSSAMLGGDQLVSVCGNTALDLSVLYTTTGMTATWTLAGVPVPDPSSVSGAGAYQLVVSNGSGCGDTAMVTLTVVAPPVLGADVSTAVCSGDAADLTTSFNTAGLSTVWTLTGSAVPDPSSVNAPGQYMLIATNPGGCADTGYVDLTLETAPVLGPDQSLSMCAGSVADLTALYATGAYTTSWTENGVPVASPASITSAGSYTLTATNSAGCATVAVVTITLAPAPALGADQSIDVCGNASLDLDPLYSTAGLSTSWTLMGVPVADPSSVSAAGTYQLVASNGSGCMDTALVSVNAIASPALGADASAALCAGNSADLTTIFTTTGLGTAWTLTGAPVPDASSVNAAGTYTLIASNAEGCSDTAHVDVTVSANPVLGPDQSLTECAGTIVDLTVLYATGTNATAWTENGVPVASPASITSAGSYTLTATNAAGCTATAVVSLALSPAPSLGADQSASICAGSTFNLTSVYSTTGLTAVWTLSGAPVAADVDVTGDYQLVVTNGFGCADTAVLTLMVNPGPALGADLWFTLCPWQTVDLSAVFPVAGLTASYTLNGQPVVDPAAVADTGTYVVTVTDENGCMDEALASVTAMECMCVADFTYDARCIQEPARFTLLADSAVISAHWEFGAAMSSTEIDPEVRFSSEGDVLVTLEATLSCGVVTVERTIRLDDCSDSCSVWMPSAFTPDNDAKNDTWGWYGACVPADFSMMIYNRWGELVFSSNDPQGSWDGMYGGTLSPPGVYAYRAGYRLPYQKRKEVRGAITLVR